VSRKNFSRGARTRACRVHTHVNARRALTNLQALQVQPPTPLRMSARPLIVFNPLNQACRNRIPLNIPRDPAPLTFVPHPMIVRFAPPELLPSAPEQLVRFSSRKPLERLKQFARRYQRKQQHVNMVSHNRKRPKPVMAQLRTFEERINHPLRDDVQHEESRPGASRVKETVHPNEGLTSGTLSGRREPRARQATVQVPSNKKPAPLRINMGKPTLSVHATIGAIPPEEFSVAHALVRAVFALLRTQAFGKDQGVHTSVNAARTNACATS
jgi:hypothetical protein